MPGRIDDTMLAALAAVGSPAEVADDIVARFGGLADRVGFYTPYLVADETLGALVDELRHADPPGPGATATASAPGAPIPSAEEQR
jgi:hypothetical protein